MRTSVEAKRGGGYRAGGGLYLVTAPGIQTPCGKLPFELTTCPTCSGGIKFSRAWTWINPKTLFQRSMCDEERDVCALCPLLHPPERAGLLWIGEKYYKTPADWTAEVHKMGVSRRIPHLPNDFAAPSRAAVGAARLHADLAALDRRKTT